VGGLLDAVLDCKGVVARVVAPSQGNEAW
jgi:hypothetical protein